MKHLDIFGIGVLVVTSSKLGQFGLSFVILDLLNQNNQTNHSDISCPKWKSWNLFSIIVQEKKNKCLNFFSLSFMKVSFGKLDTIVKKLNGSTPPFSFEVFQQLIHIYHHGYTAWLTGYVHVKKTGQNNRLKKVNWLKMGFG